MSYTDLRDFEPEYTETFEDEGLTVQLEKLGGGTLGEEHTGRWRYIVSRLPAGEEVARGDDLDTPMPHTHAEAASVLVGFFELEL